MPKSGKRIQLSQRDSEQSRVSKNIVHVIKHIPRYIPTEVLGKNDSSREIDKQTVSN